MCPGKIQTLRYAVFEFGRTCLPEETDEVKKCNIKFKKTKNKLFEDIERRQNHLFNVRFFFFQVELRLFVHFVPYV